MGPKRFYSQKCLYFS